MTKTPGSVAQMTTGVAAGMAILYFLRPVLVPFFLAVLLRVLIGGIVGLVIRLFPRAPRWLVLVATAAIVGFTAYSTFIVLLQGMADLVKHASALASHLNILAHSVGIGIGRRLDLATILGWVDLPALERSLVAGFGDVVSEGFLTLFFLVFMLLGPTIETDPKVAKIAATETRAEMQREIFRTVIRGVQKYLISQTIVNFFIAVLAGAAFHLFGLANTAFWAVVVFLLAFMPVVGPVVASIAPALFAALSSRTVSTPVAVFLIVLVIFQIAHNLVLPKMQSRSINTDPLVGMFALGIWTLLWGVPGAILSTPLTVLMMAVAAQNQSTRWLAVFLSYDGNPDGKEEKSG